MAGSAPSSARYQSRLASTSVTVRAMWWTVAGNVESFTAVDTRRRCRWPASVRPPVRRAAALPSQRRQIPSQLGPAAAARLGEQARHVLLHRAWGEMQPRGELLVRQPVGEK